TIAIQDDVLLHSLEEDASPYMKDITTTIQQEQNQIIRDETQPLLLVNGIAGSGKTSAIMQRIAYLLYQHRAEITADNILLLSPNSTFIDYISQVFTEFRRTKSLEFDSFTIFALHYQRSMANGRRNGLFRTHYSL
ncbi:helicase, partial [Enterococcus hirae 67-03-C5]